MVIVAPFYPIELFLSMECNHFFHTLLSICTQMVAVTKRRWAWIDHNENDPCLHHQNQSFRREIKETHQIFSFVSEVTKQYTDLHFQ